MSSNNTYHIYVHGDGENNPSVVSGGGGNVTGTEQAQQPSKTEQGAVNAVKGMVSFAAVRGFANNLISYEISQVSLRTGAREYEQKLQFAQQVGNQVLNIGLATAGGFAAGGAVGALVGFLGSTIYTAISYAQNANTIETKQNLENISIGMASVRAGVSGRRGATQ